MFGGDDTNPLFPGPMGNVRIPYNGNLMPSIQLDVFGGCNGDVMNIVEETNASSVNLPMKLGRGLPIYGQHKLPVSTGLRLSYGEDDHNSSISSPGETTMVNLSSILSNSDHLQAEFVRQNDEFDQFIRIQEENIRKGINELKHQHTISLLNTLEKEVSYKLREKDVELENLHRKNKELTEKIRQITGEAQSWHYRAKQNESLINVLKSNINRVFLQGTACLKEGCGESMVDDAISSCNLDRPSSMKEPMNCKACKGKEICVLLLPCRHLCLCIDCDGFIDTCPVCRVKKAGSLQVYMS